MNLKEVKALIDQLSKAEHAYYVLNNPIMSDGEYDKLFNSLKKIEEDNLSLTEKKIPNSEIPHSSSNLSTTSVKHIRQEKIEEEILDAELIS